jgi:hypothetical protein
MLLWLLAFSPRPLACQVGAADADQADELRKAAKSILHLNPWLAEIITIHNWRIVNKTTDAHADILSADVSGSHGARPDLLILNELSHISKQEFAENLMDNASKVPHGVVCIATNAGFSGTWQEQWRTNAQTSDRWHFSTFTRPAPWLDPAEIDEAKRRNPPLRFARLWQGQWAGTGGDALTADDVHAAFFPDLQPMTGNEEGYLFIAGVDLGLTRDASAVVVLAVSDRGLGGPIRLAHHRLWRPTLGRKIDLIDVERHILALDAQYGLEAIAYDPWQAEHLAATLEADTGHRRRNQRRRFESQPRLREIPPTAAHLREQATLIIESFQDRRFLLFPCEPLRRDLLALRVEEKSYGIRLTSPRDGAGHGDSFSAFAVALLVAHELAGKRPIEAGTFTEDERDRIALSSAMSQFLDHAEAFEQQQQQFLHGEDHQAPWREYMRRCGRL